MAETGGHRGRHVNMSRGGSERGMIREGLRDTTAASIMLHTFRVRFAQERLKASLLRQGMH